MSLQAAQLLVQQVTDLFSLPAVHSQIQNMIRDPRFSMDDIAAALSKDPALTSRLLRIVNSPFYGFQSRIDTVSRAIAVVGIEDLYNLVIATCVVDKFAGVASDLCDMTGFWFRSVRCAVLCRCLAKYCGLVHAERLFVAGLLHDIGSLVMYQVAPDKATTVLRTINGNRRLLPTVERDVFGFTNADVGYFLLKHWRLPDALTLVVRDQLDPDVASHFRHDIALLCLSCRLLDEDERTGAGSSDSAVLDVLVATNMSLDAENLCVVMKQADVEVDSIISILGLNKRHFQGSGRPH